MKLSSIIIILGILQVSAAGYGQKINLKTKTATLVEVFEQIKAQTGYEVLCDASLIKTAPTTKKVDFKDADINQVLKAFFPKTGFAVTLIDRTIVIREVPDLDKNEPESKIEPLPQTEITGTVIDSTTREPLAGSTVQVKGTTNGTITDEKGQFTLTVSDNDVTLVVSLVGYSRKEIPVNGVRKLEIELSVTTEDLDQLIVVGYGTQKKSDITGAVSSISATDISNAEATNPIEAIKGKSAGVDVINGGNEPGKSMTIRIRGENSITASNDPLVIIDGIPALDGLNSINPNDIASIEVLKDASASAIYGSRASNGVVLITTKRGKKGKTVVSYDGYFGVTSISHKLDLMNGPQFAQMRREAYRTESPTNEYPKDEDIFDNIALESLAKGISTDWQDLMYHTGTKQNHSISVNGGSESTQFAVSFNYYDEKGIIDKTDFNRGSFRLNLDHQINKGLRFGLSSFAAKSKQSLIPIGAYDDILRLNPLGLAYDSEGNVLFRPTNDENQRVNPISTIDHSANDIFKTRVFASFYGELDLTKDLTYRLNVGPEAELTRNGDFMGSLTVDNQGGNATASLNNTDIFSITVENILKYNKVFAQKHNLDVTLLQSYQDHRTNLSGINVQDLPYESQLYFDLGSAAQINGVGTSFEDWKMLSYMARFNYQYDNRYYLTLTGRADGSSRFSKGHKFGFFPSASAAWRIKNESFLSSVQNLSDLKLRVSYGSTGNTAINPYQTFARLSPLAYDFGGTGVIGYIPTGIANPDLRWETTRELNIGVDFGVLKNRISGSIEYYRANTKNLLLARSLPGSSGFESVLQNIGSTRNTGWELTVKSINLNTPGGFRWETNLNLAQNRNRITQLFGDNKDDIGNNWFIGQPINVYYDFKKIGIWQQDEKSQAEQYGYKVGQIKLADINNDGKLDADDRVILGSSTPDWIGGMTNTFSYKGLELYVAINTRQHYLTFSRWYDNNNRLAGRYNNINIDYWTPEHPTNEAPRPDQAQESAVRGETMAYRNVSFVRIQNISLSYTFSQKITQRLHLGDLRIGINGSNPFTFTKYIGFDPEFESDGDRALYPSTKMYSVSLHASF